MHHDLNFDGTCAVPSVSQPRRKLHVENSLPGKIVRRWSFFVRYLRARAHFDVVRRFQPILDRSFQHEWLAGTAVKLRFLPGKEQREVQISWPGDKYLLRFRYLPWREEFSLANWGAPITATVFKKGKDGGRPETVRYMSMFIKDNIIHIAQLQGIPLIEMPKGLRDWAERFVKATMEFAQQENFRGIWIARAESLYSYHHPYIRRFLSPEVQERDLKRIRSNIEIHHNQTAIDLGLHPAEDWFEWTNPAYKPVGAPPAELDGASTVTAPQPLAPIVDGSPIAAPPVASTSRAQ